MLTKKPGLLVRAFEHSLLDETVTKERDKEKQYLSLFHCAANCHCSYLARRHSIIVVVTVTYIRQVRASHSHKLVRYNVIYRLHPVFKCLFVHSVSVLS